MSLHNERHFIDWIVGVLTDGGLTVGDSKAPESVPTDAGYCVVYSIAGGVTDGSLEAPRSDAAPNVQVTSTSFLPDQTRYVADRVRTLLDAAVPATLPDGRHVTWIDFPMASMTMIRDDDAQPPRFYIPDRFELGTSA